VATELPRPTGCVGRNGSGRAGSWVVVGVDMTAHDDLRARWMPSPRSMRQAGALLAAEPAAALAVVPMYQTG
jgi:hypothetical protein